MSSSPNRIVGIIALGFVLVFAALSLIGARSQPTELCINPEDRERARGLMLESIDQALKEQTIHVFEIWMKDNTEQPTRAIQGMRNTLLAYTRSRAAVLVWNPPPCKK